MKGLDLTLTARYDDYKNGFGTSFNNLSPKASLSFRPIKDLLLRGWIGQGYRAPTLFENLRPFTSGNNTNANWSDRSLPGRQGHHHHGQSGRCHPR